MTEKMVIMRPTPNAQRPTPNAQRPTPNAQRPTPNAQPILFSKLLITFLKIIISGILSLFILTLLSFFYANITGFIPDPEGATNEKLTPHAFYSYAEEGFSIGRFNNDGYNNLFDYERGMKIDVLIMGSSHMAAFQVMQKYNTANVLRKISDRVIYNIGVGAHNLPVCISNLEAAVKKYKPEEYIVIEADSVFIDDDTLTKIILAGKFNRPAQKKGIIRLLLRKNPYFTLLWMNFNNYMRNNFHDKNLSANNFPVTNRPELLSKVLMQMKEKVSEHSNAKIIIAYHPSISLNKDGNISINGDSNIIRQFSEFCAQNGIYFVDTGKRFLDEYAENHILPYGFMNTSVGAGHMNKYGHRMFAEEIYKLIQRIEAQS